MYYGYVSTKISEIKIFEIPSYVQLVVISIINLYSEQPENDVILMLRYSFLFFFLNHNL